MEFVCRLRDFSAAALLAREQDLVQVVTDSGMGMGMATITQQYVDMGPSLRVAPERTALPT